MANEFTFSISGINIHASNENAADLNIQRTAQGAVITQKGGTTNWFSLAIPTFENAGQTRSKFLRAGFRGKVNRAARIDQVQVRLSGDDVRLVEEHFSLSNEDIFNAWCSVPNPGVELYQSAVLSIHIAFETLEVDGDLVEPHVVIYEGTMVIDRA